MRLSPGQDYSVKSWPVLLRKMEWGCLPKPWRLFLIRRLELWQSCRHRSWRYVRWYRHTQGCPLDSLLDICRLKKVIKSRSNHSILLERFIKLLHWALGIRIKIPKFGYKTLVLFGYRNPRPCSDTETPRYPNSVKPRPRCSFFSQIRSYLDGIIYRRILKV